MHYAEDITSAQLFLVNTVIILNFVDEESKAQSCLVIYSR